MLSMILLVFILVLFFYTFFFYLLLFSFFFFKQKTAYEMRISDWSSDVCSSDLDDGRRPRPHRQRVQRTDRRAPRSAGPATRLPAGNGPAEADSAQQPAARRQPEREQRRAQLAPDTHGTNAGRTCTASDRRRPGRRTADRSRHRRDRGRRSLGDRRQCLGSRREGGRGRRKSVRAAAAGPARPLPRAVGRVRGANDARGVVRARAR